MIMEFVLASESVKRREILESLGMKFQVVPSNCEELISHESPTKLTVENALLKAEVVSKAHPDCIILGVDTIVFVREQGQGEEDGRIFFKPTNQRELEEMYETYYRTSQKGGVNQVISGLCLIVPGQSPLLTHEVSSFVMIDYPAKERNRLRELIGDSSKSGGFSIEGIGAALFDQIEGSYYNILGLPVHSLFLLFHKAKIDWFDFK